MKLLNTFLSISLLKSTIGFTSYHHRFCNIRTYMSVKKSNQIFLSHLYKPKTENQKTYVESLNDEVNKIVVVNGPAGTGKTLFACQKAIILMKMEKINKIIITRPVVTVEEEIGFLPGNLIKKMDPWTKPLFDIFLEFYSKSELDLMLNNNKIEICPLAFMRGRTFKNAFIIADEMQNSSPNQMKMLITRLGDNCRMVITGDLQQSDIQNDNGLNDFLKKLQNFNNYNNKTKLIDIVYFNNTDVERSDIVKKVIEIYDFKPSEKNYYNNINNTITNFNFTQNRFSISNNTKLSNYVEKKLNEDCALIPKNQVSKNYNDIFFYEREF